MSSTKDRIKAIILSVLEDNELSFSGEILEDTLLGDDLGMKSLSLAQMTVMIEDEFGVDVYENGVIRSVGEIFRQFSGE